MPQSNNPSLQSIRDEDQLDRFHYTCRKLSMENLHKRDRKRLLAVIDLVNSKEVKTVTDYLNAAIVFQHGRNAEGERDLYSSEMAIKMMRKAIELEPTTSKWLLAAAIDRNLMISGKPQIYGTQYTRKVEYGPWELYDLDGSQVSDEERVAHLVVKLAEQAESLKNMNRIGLLELYFEKKTVDQIIAFCETEDPATSLYNVSESGIFRLAIQLMKLEKNEAALTVFEFNARQFPENPDTFHSLGYCLEKMGKKEAAIKAFEASLKVDPTYGEAIRDLARLKEEAKNIVD